MFSAIPVWAQEPDLAAAAAENVAFYHPRNPRVSPLFRLLEEHCEEFERVYLERYQQRYGFWRPVIRSRP